MPQWPTSIPSVDLGPVHQIDPPAESTERCRDDDAGKWLAEHLELVCFCRWVVMWQPYSQRFTAIWKGPSPSGIECTAATPNRLWDLMARIDLWVLMYTDGPKLDGPEAAVHLKTAGLRP